ncbi:MAG TPA: hypothetical protein VN958_21025 [Chitinophagaceae bacterium]|nr:hypothetical protein [Chitinophagaceae bacterium]
MKGKRKIEPVVRKVSFAEAEEDNSDLLFWAEKSVQERMRDMLNWNQKVWTMINGQYPKTIEKTGEKRKKADTDEDDF